MSRLNRFIAIRYALIALLLIVVLGASARRLPAAEQGGQGKNELAGLTSQQYLPIVWKTSVARYLPVIHIHRPREFLPVIFARPACTVFGADCLEPNYDVAAPFPGFNRAVYATVYSTTILDARYDYYAFYLVAGTRVTITLSGGTNAVTPFTAPADLDLYLYDNAWSFVTGSNFSGQSVETIVFVPPASTTYQILVYAYNSLNAPVPYRIEVRDRP